jgi:hypothetical protein
VGPGLVRITVRGQLSDRLAAAFEGMTPIPLGRDTELQGEVADQAQLHGLLNRIRDLGLELTALSVSPSTHTPPSDSERSPNPTSAKGGTP